MNSGTQSSYPTQVRDFIFEHKEKYRVSPTRGHFEFVPSIWKAQKSMADFFNLDPNDFFFCHNVTEALNHFILGLESNSLKRIITTDLEYGATLNICRFRSEKDGVPLNTIKLENLIDENLIVDYEKFKDELRTNLKSGDLLVLSHIMTSNGDILPIAEISKICHEKGALIAVDGAHAPGAFKNDFSKFKDLDFYGGNLHKWMMGPPGTGFGWINKKSASKVSSQLAGWPTYDNAFHLEEFKGQGTAKEFYLKGTFDFSNFMSLNSLMDFWNTVGEEKIYTARRELRSQLNDLMSTELGWKLISNDWKTCPLISYETPKKISEMGWDYMVNLWHEHNLIVSTPKFFGKHILRLSPNIYNNSEQIVKTVEKLKLTNN